MARRAVAVLVIGLAAAGCSGAAGPFESTVPAAVAQASTTSTPAAQTTPATPAESTSGLPALPADLILFDGTLITMEEAQPNAQAIAVRDGLIQAVGSDEEILALRGPDTEVVDLRGRTLMPGFVDGHTHLLAFHDRMGRTLEEAQQVALRYGITSVNEMWADQGYVDKLLQAAADGTLVLRVSTFVNYNDGYRGEDGRRVISATWFPAHAPILDPGSRFRIVGIKLYLDGDHYSEARGCWAVREPLPAGAEESQGGLCGSVLGDLYWEQDELNQVVRQAQDAGYRAAFHAMGDRAIEAALNAIEYALDGRSNEVYRHQIQHNSLLAADLLPRYQALDVAVSVRGYGDFCDLSFVDPAFGAGGRAWYANRYQLPGLDIHAYVETDYGWTVDPDDRYAQRSLDPIMQLYGLVTHRYVSEDGTACEPDPLVQAHQVSVERALEMLTIEPAWAVSMEDHVGSLRAGKFADLIVLSGNPVAVAATDLRDLRVLATLVDGRWQYCAEGGELVCGGTGGPGQSTTTAAPPTSAEPPEDESQADMLAIEALWEGFSASWAGGLQAGVDYIMAHNYPDLTCSAEDWLTYYRDGLGWEEGEGDQVVVHPGTIVRQDDWGWVVPAGYPGAGEPAQGRVYVMTVDSTAPGAGGSPETRTLNLHATVIGSAAYFFFECE